MMTDNLVHSKFCRKSNIGLTKGMGFCNACDTLKSLKIKKPEFTLDQNRIDIDADRLDSVYCKKAKTIYPRCTKKTYPQCACGKLVYFRAYSPDGRFED